MRIRTLWLALALLGALGLVGATLVEAGDKDGPRDGFGDKAGKGGDKGGKGPGFQGGPGRGGPGGRGLNVDDTVDRIMSFDKNKDGKIDKDELPERIQHLIALGDTNKDGALDRDEIKKLATTLETFLGFAGQAGPGGFAPPGPPPGDFRPGGPPPGGTPPSDGVRRILNDLNLSAKTREKADEVVKAHQENVRKLMEQTRGDLLVKMKDVLSEQELKNFKDALERQPLPPPPGAFRPGEAPRPGPGDLERRLDELQRQFQRQVDDLRRELRR